MNFIQGSKNCYLVILTADIIAFITGTSIAWSSPVLPILTEDTCKNPLERKITTEEESWIGSLSAMGGIFGPFIFGHLGQTIGRKLTITLITLPFLVAYLMAAFARTVELYYVARLLMGMGVGGMFSTLPIYVSETSENSNRGLLQASTTSGIMLGLFFSYCVGPYVSIMTFNLILSGICVLFVPLFWFVAPETPYFLIRAQKDDHALKSLCYLRNKSETEVRQELDEIKSHNKKLQPGSFLDIFKTKGTIKAFFYSVALTTFQQFSGVTVILYYAQNIFNATGSDVPPEISSIIIGGAQFLVSTISPPFLDKVGRKNLLLVAVSGATVAEVLLGVYFYLQKNGDDVSNLSWLPVFSLVLFIGFYNFGMGSIPWAFMGETLPLNVISKAAMTVTGFYWFTGFFLTKYFDSLSGAIGMAGSFWFFAGFCALFDLFVIFFMFETKGKSLGEIQDILNE